jgi:PDZ domain-containing protein
VRGVHADLARALVDVRGSGRICTRVLVQYAAGILGACERRGGALGAFKASSVLPGGPMDKAGLQPGDVLEAISGQPLNGAADWFLARAHFERDHPVELQVRRGGQHLALRLVIAAPVWRTWNRADYLPPVALYVARFVLLLLAILVGFSRPQQLSARLAALMFAIGAVAEGYPSSGWAAALRNLPAVLAVPIGLATASWLLAPVVWLAFFASFPLPRFRKDRDGCW